MAPLILAVVFVASSAVAGLARVGTGVINRARADSVADVVALSAVVGGPEVADDLARANGAELVSIIARDDGSTVVRIELNSVNSTAAAAPGF